MKKGFLTTSIKNYFKDNEDKYELFKNEITSFINSLDQKIKTDKKEEAKTKHILIDVVNMEGCPFERFRQTGASDDLHLMDLQDVDGK